MERTARGERTRERLLEAAREAFDGVGWSRTRVEDVCRAAGCGHGTYYAYFANKAAILEALVRRHAADLYELVEADWTSGDVRADVRRVIEGFAALSERDRDVRAIWAAAAPSEPVLAELVDEVRAQFVRRIRSSLVGAAEAGLSRPGLDVDVAAAALAGMVEQAVARAEQPRARLVDGLTDLWVSAVYQVSDARLPGPPRAARVARHGQ